MWFQTKIPLKYCGNYVLAVVYLINRLSSPIIGNQSPYERLHHKKPLLTHLRVLDCLCFAEVLTGGDKLQPRSKVAVHMGYSEVQKGYVLFDLMDKIFFVSSNVIFKEIIFLFTKLS